MAPFLPCDSQTKPTTLKAKGNATFGHPISNPGMRKGMLAWEADSIICPAYFSQVNCIRKGLPVKFMGRAVKMSHPRRIKRNFIKWRPFLSLIVGPRRLLTIIWEKIHCLALKELYAICISIKFLKRFHPNVFW